MNEVRLYNDREWLWPTADYHCWKHLTIQHPSVPEDILNTIYQTGGRNPSNLARAEVKTVVQAGGNCGLYTAAYAKHVDQVITFEPEPNNFHCLKENIKEDNVIMYEVALGDRTCNVGLRTDPINSGAASIINDGTIPQVKLDDYNLEPDLIHLDIEGHEQYALIGMLETIEKCHPAVALEHGNGEEMLFNLGYKKHKKIGLDWLYL
tara:strand:- start:184 stop:804 length:621 start_codon:yes stop_codon:yes gene_type:complete